MEDLQGIMNDINKQIDEYHIAQYGERREWRFCDGEFYIHNDFDIEVISSATTLRCWIMEHYGKKECDAIMDAIKLSI